MVMNETMKCFYSSTSKVLTVILRGNSTNAYISYQSFLPEKANIGLIIRYVPLNIVGNSLVVIPKPNIFTRIRTHDSFLICDSCSCNLPAETNNSGLGAIILSNLVSELQKHSHRDLNSGQFSEF
jgi:hypothetical protein